MSDAGIPPRIPKWPFYFADVVLSGLAAFVLYRLGSFEGPYEALIIFGALVCAVVGAWISVKPWLTEHRSQVGLEETSNLKNSLQQISQVEQVADRIQQANSQWQAVQDSASRTVTAAQEIADRMKLETEDFMKFIDNARDQEKNHLKLEIDKLRRLEGDWLKVVVQLLDHTFALNQAAVRSGHANVIAQMENFQNACREVTRRIGLTTFVPAPGEKFDPRGHQTPDPKFTPPENSYVGEILATGYTYQGQLLRRALVLLAQPAGNEQTDVASESPSSIAKPPLEEAEPTTEPSEVFEDLPPTNSEVEDFEEGDLPPVSPLPEKPSDPENRPQPRDRNEADVRPSSGNAQEQLPLV